jgi:type I restriction enzyme R subunit
MAEGRGYTHLLGGDIHRNFKKVVLDDNFAYFLLENYPQLPPDVLSDAGKQLLFKEGADPDIRNRSFHLKLSNGLNLSWQDKDGRTCLENIYPIDYKNPENNQFLAVNQFTVEGRNTRRADLILFVNGF